MEGVRCLSALPMFDNGSVLHLLYRIHFNKGVTSQQLTVSGDLSHSVFFHLHFVPCIAVYRTIVPTGKLLWLKSCKNHCCGLPTVCNHIFLKAFSTKAFTFITILFLMLIVHANSRYSNTKTLL